MDSVFAIFQAIFNGVEGLVGSVFDGAQGVFNSIKSFSS